MLFSPDPPLSPSPLLSLPFELRAQIFHHALSHPPHLVTFRLDHVQAQYYTSATPLPALTRVNRQIRAETLPLFFQRNTFVLHAEEPKILDAKAWLRSNIVGEYLGDFRRLEVWVRYVPLGGARGGSGSGCFGVMLRRERKGVEWRIEKDGVRWVTVTRKPVDWESDGKLLTGLLGGKLGGLGGDGVEAWIAFLDGLRDEYCWRKVHGAI
jgi:hypothetical protein